MFENRTILVVDDTKENLDIIIEILSEYDVIPSTNGADAIDILESEDVSLILLDIMMPDLDGFEVCKIIKSNPKIKNIPIIFLTAKSDEESIECAYDIGGVDYVTKPFKPKELLVRIKTQLRLKSIIDELENLASLDYLTQIYNRRKFFNLGNEVFKKNQNITLVMADIDKFKSINDTYGHNVGDIVIKSFAKFLKDILDRESIFARLGGEEFAILYINANQDYVISQIESIRDAIEQLDIFVNSQKINFTVSFGIASKNENIKTLDSLIIQADNNLYSAKNSGRNRVIF